MTRFGEREGRVERRKERIKMKTKLFPPFSFLSLINRGNYTPGRWRNR